MEPNRELPIMVNLYSRYMMLQAILLQMQSMVDGLQDLCRKSPASVFATETVDEQVQHLDGSVETCLEATRFLLQRITEDMLAPRTRQPDAMELEQSLAGYEETGSAAAEEETQTVPANLQAEAVPGNMTQDYRLG